MATILEFRTHPRLAGLQHMASRAHSTPAEIVFFPGVRYERWDDSPAETSGKRPGRRDKLELQD